MPCLGPHAHASPSSSALWITDHVLAAAWRRFVPVPHSRNHDHNPRNRNRTASRRHGSNVPGPLEARRRLARRRMGLSAHAPPSNGGVGADFGALLGFGTRGVVRQDLESGWRWEAPTPTPRPTPTLRMQKTEGWVGDGRGETWVEEKGGTAWGSGWPAGGRKRKDEEMQEDIAEEKVVDGDQADPIHTSREAFGEILADIGRAREVQEEDVLPALAFLQSPADEVEAKNTSSLLTWLARRNVVLSERVLDVVRDKFRLQTISIDECADILHTVLQTTPLDRCTALIRSLAPTEMRDEVCAATTRLVVAVEEKDKKGKPSPAVETWLSCLRSLNVTCSSPLWREVYAQLAHTWPRPAALCTHLSTLEETDLADVLLHYWVPQMLNLPHDHLAGENESEVEDGVVFGNANIFQLMDKRRLHLPRGQAPRGGVYMKQLWKRPRDARDGKTLPGAVTITYETPGKHGHDDAVRLSFPAPSPTHITRLWQSWTALPTPPPTPNGRVRRHPLVDLLHLVAAHRYPYAELATDIFVILTDSTSPHPRPDRAIFAIYRLLRESPSIGIPAALATHMVHHFLSHHALRYALYVFRSVPALPLSEFHPLALALAADSRSVPSAAIWYVLNRNTAVDRTESPVWNARQSLLLRPDHVHLVHRVALTFAQQETLRPRVAFRRVWECYRFVKDRGAAVGNLMSQAMVTAGVIRLLKAEKRIPTEQMRFVLSVVEAVEGAEVAEGVDRRVWEIWKREVLPRVLSRRVVAEEEMVGSERWRCVHWARVLNGEYGIVRGRGHQPRDGGHAAASSPQAGPQFEAPEGREEENARRNFGPFPFDDVDEDIPRSSPRAGADIEDIPLTSQSKPEGPTDAVVADGVSRTTASPLDERLSISDHAYSTADHGTTWWYESPERTGLGYETCDPSAKSTSEGHDRGDEVEEEQEEQEERGSPRLKIRRHKLREHSRVAIKGGGGAWKGALIRQTFFDPSGYS